MAVYVLDSSVVAKLFLLEDDSHQAKAVLQHAIDGHITLLCPMLMLYEVVNAFIIQNLDVEAIKTYIDELEGLIDNEIITIVPASQELLAKATEIAATDTQGLGYISSYDAAFHALALTAGGTLLTADVKHAQKTKTLFGSVAILADFSVKPADD